MLVKVLINTCLKVDESKYFVFMKVLKSAAIRRNKFYKISFLSGLFVCRFNLGIHDMKAN